MLGTALDDLHTRKEIVEQVRRFGGPAIDALLEPGCSFFSIPEIEGLIGYRHFAGCSIVFGDPVCRRDEAPHLALAFHRQMKSCQNIIYLAASENFARLIHPGICEAFVEYGKECFLDPHCNPKDLQGPDACVLRRKVRRAIKIGLSVKEFSGNDNQIQFALEEVGRKWLKSRHGPQIHIANIHLFDNPLGKRWFYVLQGENIIGIATLNRLESYQGWLLNNLMCAPQAPAGTQELLVDEILESLRRENCSYVSFGIAPADRLGEISGLSPFSRWAARQGYKISKQLFHLDGHQMFWRKFFPQSRLSCILLAKPKIGLRELYALKKATNASIKI